jgi:hypothetical protein
LLSAKDLKFGRFKGEEAPGKGQCKKPEETILEPPREKRPAVPRFRHPPIKKPEADPPKEELSQGETANDPEEKLETNGDKIHPTQAHIKSSPKRTNDTSPERTPRTKKSSTTPASQLPTYQSQKLKAEPKPVPLCEWCNKDEDWGHSRHCKFRPTQCSYCGQTLALAVRIQHERTCGERPITMNELKGRIRTPSSGRRENSSSRGPSRHMAATHPGVAEAQSSENEQVKTARQTTTRPAPPPPKNMEKASLLAGKEVSDNVRRNQGTASETPRQQRPCLLEPLAHDQKQRQRSASSERQGRGLSKDIGFGSSTPRGLGTRPAKLRERSKESEANTPGLAAIGYRDEATLEDLKAEIEQERQRYIARRLSELSKQQQPLVYRPSPRRGRQRSSSPSSRYVQSHRESSSRSQSVASIRVPSVTDFREQLQKERAAFISQLSVTAT